MHLITLKVLGLEDRFR